MDGPLLLPIGGKRRSGPRSPVKTDLRQLAMVPVACRSGLGLHID